MRTVTGSKAGRVAFPILGGILLFALLWLATSTRAEVVVDYGSWNTAVASAKTATTTWNNPFTASADANPSTAYGLHYRGLNAYEGKKGVIVRLKYPAGGTITQDCIVRVWSKKGTTYFPMRDPDDTFDVTLTSAATDMTDGTYNWSDPSLPLDALGGTDVIVTVKQAAVCAAGAVVVEISGY